LLRKPVNPEPVCLPVLDSVNRVQGLEKFNRHLHEKGSLLCLLAEYSPLDLKYIFVEREWYK
jgi:hypothetical protein